ncbi:MAG: hypothetical protein LBU00_04285 [Treponema sp.]|jgi:hypothetical protein|nr:hypothetical protein [Treponema sp.]
MAENVVREPQRGLSFDDVWAALMGLKNVRYHVKRLEEIKKYPPDQYKGKKLLGGIV